MTLWHRSIICKQDIEWAMEPSQSPFDFILLTFIPEMDNEKLQILLLSLRNGEKKAFEEIYTDFFGVLYNLSIQSFHAVLNGFYGGYGS